ncbi:MAG TPA: pentapeptide repeat-containing protein [Tepidisphaeraceae bacterium]|nr:pentapeptide repeat-containing protein [Tepidisphaeraceae bacterium]
MSGKRITFAGRVTRLYRWQRGRVRALAEAQQATIIDKLDASTHYLVVPEMTEAKQAQKVATALNANGAAVQILDLDAFEKLVSPTADQLSAIIKGGPTNAELLTVMLGGSHAYLALQQGVRNRIVSENFDNLDLSKFNFRWLAFENCSFRRAKLVQTHFGECVGCDFTDAECQSSYFADASSSRFCKCNLTGAHIHGAFENTDCTDAIMDSAEVFTAAHRPGGKISHNGAKGVTFRGASLRKAKFQLVQLDHPDFQSATMQGAQLDGCIFTSPDFSCGDLQHTEMGEGRFPGANFSGATLRGANLARCDLTGARIDDANLEDADLSGAKFDGADLSKARNYGVSAVPAGSIGPALTELDCLGRLARHIKVQFKYQAPSGGELHQATVHIGAMHYVWGTELSHEGTRHIGYSRSAAGMPASEILLRMAARIKNFIIRYETLEAKSPKSPKTGKELRQLVMNAIAEASLQAVPPADKLAEAIKAHRQQTRAANAGKLEQAKAARKQREEYKQREEKLRQRELKKLEKTIQKKVGKITDIATFLKALELRADPQKIDKATRMLKADRFKLFNDVTEDHLSGVVKSQSDPDLLYACRIHKDGQYACCTQNMNICGGLRGSVCKHLLVLIVGLVKAGQLDPGVIDSWISKTHGAKPVLDKEIMGEIFLKYKGAEAGEIDWRPTETLPEDFYAV